MKDQTEETIRHIMMVNIFLGIITGQLSTRAVLHDRSKLESPEKEIFDEYTPKLKNVTYGSNQYKQYLKEMKPALDHHYANNRHHPEYFKNKQKPGQRWEPLKEMNLVDIIEMLCDWKAASMRHNDGDIRKSIEINQKRFGYSYELKNIFMNTIDLVESIYSGDA